MATTELRTGATLAGRFRIRSRGTSRELGNVYVAWDTIENRSVHLLVLAPRYGTGQEAASRLAKLQGEVAALRRPGLVPFELVGAQRRRGAEGLLFLVRSLLAGQTLASKLAQEGSLQVRAALEIATSVCLALAPAHRSGLVHGSLSPHNVLLQDGDTPLVTDAGLWPALHPTRDRRILPRAPSPWRSPEQTAGEPARPAADVFSVGALLYFMLTGRPPFGTGLDALLPDREPTYLQQLTPKVPNWLAVVVHKTLALEPSQRYRNAGQLLQILRSGAYADLESAPAEPPVTHAAPPTWPSAPQTVPAPLPAAARAGARPRGQTAASPAPATSWRIPASGTYQAPVEARPPPLPAFEPSLLDAGAPFPEAWSYVPGTDLPALYDPAVAYRRRRRATIDVVLIALLIGLLLGVLGLVVVWWAANLPWSDSSRPGESLPTHHHGDSLPSVSLARIGFNGQPEPTKRPTWWALNGESGQVVQSPTAAELGPWALFCYNVKTRHQRLPVSITRLALWESSLLHQGQTVVDLDGLPGPATHRDSGC